MKLPLKLKPSLLGQYYEKQCDKFLVYNSVDKKQYKSLGWIEPVGFQQSAAAMAGVEWERIILERLQQDASCEVINLKQGDGSEVSLVKTVEAFKNIKPGDKTIYFYQACFGITPSFESKYLSKVRARSGRYEFVGEKAPEEIRAKYVNKRLPKAYRKKGMASPVLYGKGKKEK